MGGNRTNKVNDYRGQGKSNRRLKISQMHCMQLTILKVNNKKRKVTAGFVSVQREDFG